MKTELVLKKMMLLGFMLMAVSINVFANNANEGKNSVNRNGEYIFSISANPGTTDYLVEIEEGALGTISIVPPVGYTVDGIPTQIPADGSVQLINDGSRGLVIRFIATWRGRTILRVRLLSIGEGSGGFTIDIVINIKLPSSKP